MLTPAQLPSPGPHRLPVSVPLSGRSSPLLGTSSLRRCTSLTLLSTPPRFGLGIKAGGEGEGVAAGGARAGRLVWRVGGGAGEGVLLSVLS